MAKLLKSCGLEHRATNFESEGYTLEISLDALKAGTLLEDLEELKLPLGERRQFIDQLKMYLSTAPLPTVGPVEKPGKAPWSTTRFQTAPKDIRSASNSLFATHMPLFTVALMHVSTFAVLGLWTTFWPLVWCAVPASLFAMVAAGLIGTSPPTAVGETIVYRSGTIKLCAWATVILTIVSFLTACALGGVMVQQAAIWDADKGIALNCNHDESKNEFATGPNGEMEVHSMRCEDNDDCTGARCDFKDSTTLPATVMRTRGSVLLLAVLPLSLPLCLVAARVAMLAKKVHGLGAKDAPNYARAAAEDPSPPGPDPTV